MIHCTLDIFEHAARRLCTLCAASLHVSLSVPTSLSSTRLWHHLVQAIHEQPVRTAVE